MHKQYISQFNLGLGALISLTFCFLFTIHSAAAEEVTATATVDRNPVTEYSAFVLTIRTTEALGRDGFNPGSSIGDFEVRGSAMSSSVSYINGVNTRSIEWRITLLAPAAGQYEIPALQVGSMRTSPIQLQVVSASSELPQNRNYYIETELSSHSPYVQQQVTYTVRLFLAEQLEGGSLSFPQVDNLSVEQLGQDRQSQEIIDGRRFQVLTRTYGITPRRSGELTIPGVRFDGQVRRFPSGGFSALGRIEPVSTRGADITINVLPRPSDYNGTWLPSEQVSIEEVWEPNTRVFRVGEPITRKITLTAAGVRGEQLPDILANYPDAFRVYPDRGQRESALVRGLAVAKATFTTAIIPAEAGEFTLPAVTVPWWNTRTNQVEFAQLPERTIEVVLPPGGLSVPGAANEVVASNNTPQAQASTTNALSSQSNSTELGKAHVAQVRFWRVVSGVLFLLLLLCFFALLRSRQKLVNQRPTQHTPGYVPEHVRKPLQQLKKACKENNPHAARLALLSWHRARSGRPARGLTDITQSMPKDSNIGPIIANLEAALYSANHPAWQQGNALWKAIQELHQKKRQTETGLPPLYPQ